MAHDCIHREGKRQEERAERLIERKRKYERLMEGVHQYFVLELKM